MKNLNKIVTAFALVILVGSANILAQETAMVDVTAQVEAALVLTPTAVALGTIQQETSVIKANISDLATETNLGDDASAGSLVIAGSNVDVVVEFGTATLDTSPASDAIVFTPSVYFGSTSVATTETVTITGGSITLNIGGSLEAPSGTGAYSTANGSPMTFTITYD